MSSIFALFQVVFFLMELAFEFDFLSLLVSFHISQLRNFITLVFTIPGFIAGILGGNFSLFWLFQLVCWKFCILAILVFNVVMLLLAL